MTVLLEHCHCVPCCWNREIAQFAVLCNSHVIRLTMASFWLVLVSFTLTSMFECVHARYEDVACAIVKIATLQKVGKCSTVAVNVWSASHVFNPSSKLVQIQIQVCDRQHWKNASNEHEMSVGVHLWSCYRPAYNVCRMLYLQYCMIQICRPHVSRFVYACIYIWFVEWVCCNGNDRAIISHVFFIASKTLILEAHTCINIVKA